MALVLVALVVVVTLGQGGYDPWATLLLEIGACGLALWVVVDVLWRTDAKQRGYYVEQRRIWKKLPFRARHPGLDSVLRWIRPRRAYRGRGSPQIEILPPGSQTDRSESTQGAEQFWTLFGYPFKRTGLGIPVLLLTVWLALSLVPMSPTWLAHLSPQASGMWDDVAGLLGQGAGRDRVPWSLAPFLTLRSLWLWIAYLIVFYVSVHSARDARRVERLSLFLFVVGMGFGLYGIVQWLMGLQELFGADPTTSGLRASGSFGNRNHYAAFMEMLLLCGLGWMGSRWAGFLSARTSSRVGLWRRVNIVAQEAGAKVFMSALGIVVLALGLVFSLSRSGISVGLVGCALFALLVPQGESPGDGSLEIDGRGKRHAGAGGLRGRRRSFRVFLATGLVVVGVGAWLGLDPVVHRFQLLPEEWEAEKGRWQVWMDSGEAIGDFYVTGSGLSSFRYVYPTYRSFGGTVYYSWAHNDYLQALIELGVPGLVLILGILAAVFLAARQVRRRLEAKPALLYLHAGYSAAAGAIALHSLTDFGLHMPANATLFAVILGVIVGLEGHSPGTDPGSGDAS